MENKKIKSLIDIGLKEIEAEIYLILLRENNITAYKAAKIVKKPKTTVYKALEIMEKEGLIRSNRASQPITFAAVDIKEYLDDKKIQFENNRKIVENELKDIEEIPADTGIFEITKLHQVYSKAKDILNRTEKMALIACSDIKNPGIISAIRDAAQRDVKILIQCFHSNIELPEAEFVCDDTSKEFIQNLKYNWLEIFSDGKEYLISLLSGDHTQLYKAQWCNDPYTSILTYNANVGSFILSKVSEMVIQEKPYSEIENVLREGLNTYYQSIVMEVIEHLIDN